MRTGTRAEDIDLDAGTVTTGDGAVVTECTFRDCRINPSRHTRLREADLTGVRASGATLRRLDLSGAQAVVLVTALGLDVRPDAPE